MAQLLTEVLRKIGRWISKLYLPLDESKILESQFLFPKYIIGGALPSWFADVTIDYDSFVLLLEEDIPFKTTVLPIPDKNVCFGYGFVH